MDRKEQARKLYKSGLRYKDIAEQLDTPVSTLKSWRNKERWTRSESSTKHLSSNQTTDDRWKSFAAQYLQSMNATQAYMNVYKVKRSTARTNASRLLAKEQVKNYLRELKAQNSDELYLDRMDLLREEAKIAKADISDYLSIKKIEQPRIDVDGEQMLDAAGEPITDIYNEFYIDDPELLDFSPVADMHRGKDGLVVKLQDKQKAIDTLLKQLPDDKDKLEIERLKKQNKLLELKIRTLDTDNNKQMTQIDKLMQALEIADDDYAAKSE